MDVPRYEITGTVEKWIVHTNAHSIQKMKPSSRLIPFC